MEIYSAIIAAVSLLEQLVPFINKMKEIGAQDQELTADQQKEIDTRIHDLMQNAPWWKPSS